MKSLLHAKKMFIDTYGEVPPMIGFLGIDTDAGEFNNELMSIKGEVVKLDPNECLELHTPGAEEFYVHNTERFSWIPRDNVATVSMLSGVGAGGVRSNGRFAFTVNKNNIKSTVISKLKDITDAHIATDAKYSLLAAVQPEIHVAFSISGGTGCGTFLNMGYLLQEINPNFKITAYAVLPGIFQGLAASSHTVPNTYAALCDLDYLMHRGLGESNPVKLKYLDGDYTVKSRPFSNVVFIDNKDGYEYTHNDIADLTAMISLGLVTAAGQLSIAGASVGDNFNVMISMGSLDIQNKKAWASGMGACEIVYRGHTLAEVYQYKAGINIIDRMFNTCDDANTIANAWIDSSEVRIRENNGQDHVTDYICSKEPQYSLVISNYRDPAPEVLLNVETNKIKDEVIVEKTDTLLERVNTELRRLIVKYINGECGVSLAKNILEELKIQIGLCLGEMKKEKDDLVNKKPALKTSIETTLADLKEYASRMSILQSRNEREQRAADLAEAVRLYNVCLLDIQRHDAAITIYNSILIKFADAEKKIQEIERALKLVKQQLQTKVARLQNGLAGDGSVFQINLAEEDAKNITIKSEDILISEFIDSLEGNFKVYGFTEYSANEIESFIVNYTKTLNCAKLYKDRSVEDVLNDIAKRDNERLKNILSLAAVKSDAVFTYNHLGRLPRQNMIDMIYIGVEDVENSILRAGGLFEAYLPAPASLTVTRNVAFASTGMKDKIVIYHQVGVVPPYAINGVTQSYVHAYKDSWGGKDKWHFDADMKMKMDHNGYDIEPSSPIDDSMEWWIKGFIYGLIKNDRGAYYVQSRTQGQATEGYWITLGTAWRDEAYNNFKGVVNVKQEMQQTINQRNAQMGEDAVAELIRHAKENWWEVSHIKLDKKTLDSHGYEKVKSLFNDEFNYLETM